MTCESCGAVIEVGSWPYCPHGRSNSAVHQDSVEGGFWAENGFEQPTFFDSKKAHRDALAARGLMVKAKWAGPADKHLSRMDAPCATTLENAKILLSRGKVSREVEPDYDPIPITVTTIRFENTK